MEFQSGAVEDLSIAALRSLGQWFLRLAVRDWRLLGPTGSPEHKVLENGGSTRIIWALLLRTLPW